MQAIKPIGFFGFFTKPKKPNQSDWFFLDFGFFGFLRKLLEMKTIGDITGS